ncbi:MAG: DNA polymerase III subunit delta [Candidatus Acidiferrales bacterium]
MPRIETSALLERLAKGQPMPGILLLGAETYLRDLCRKAIIEAIVPENAREWGVARCDASEEDASAILALAGTPSLLASRQVVFARGIEAWEKLGEHAREALLADLAAYFAHPSASSMLVLEAESLDQRLKLWKLLSEDVLVVGLELPEDPDARARAAAPILTQMAKDAGVTLDADAAGELTELTGANLAAAQTEIAKLATYAGDRRRVTREDVETLVASGRKYSVWELAEAFASHDTERAMKFLESLLREGEQPVQIVGAMGWMCRKLLEAQDLPPQTSKFQIAGRLQMRPQMAEMALRESKRIPRKRLLEGLAALYEADSRLKSSAPNPRAILEFLVARFAGAIQ